ncbi:MAG: YwmB family TATA-box binding protein [Dethiobacteria bacterium]|jgi:hypothetical protein
MRRFLFIAFILLIIGGALFMGPGSFVSRETNPYMPLYRVMELAGAEVVEGELHYWASLGEHPEIVTLQQLETKADQLFKRITTNNSTTHNLQKDIVEAASFTVDGTDLQGFNPPCMVVEREGYLGTGALVHLTLQVMDVEGKNVVHLLVTITEQGSARQLSSTAHRVPSLLESEVESGNLSFCLTGHLEERFSGQDMETLALAIARDLGGDEVQGFQDGSMVSVTGYTPDLGDYFRAEGLRVNLNLAMRYDEYLGKTVIWAGSPLVARWY